MAEFTRGDLGQLHSSNPETTNKEAHVYIAWFAYCINEKLGKATIV